MKRRQAIQTIFTLPAIAALPLAAQEKTATSGQKLPAELKPTAVEATPQLTLAQAEAAVPTTPRFFSKEQLQTLRRLSDLLVPAFGEKPGGGDAGVPEFLDFLIEESGNDRRALYRNGLDRLDTESRRRFRKPFADASIKDAESLLAPLREPWTFEGPADPFARFLNAAKDDILRATVNSRQWAAASTTGRRGAGVGTYWFSIE